MKTMVLLLMVALLEYGTGPGDVVAQVQQKCPAEVAQARAALKGTQTATKSKAVAEGPQDIQAPRSAAGARTQGVNAPRTQEVNALADRRECGSRISTRPGSSRPRDW